MIEEVKEILATEINTVINENLDRFERAIEHIKLQHDPDYFLAYVCDGKDGVYFRGRTEPYKNDMQNWRTLRFEVKLCGKIR